VLAGAEGLEVTLLINCAGLAASCSNFEDTAEAQLQKEMAVNVLTPMYLTRSLLPGMIQRGGTVLNIASVAALLPAPYMATTVQQSLDTQLELGAEQRTPIHTCQGDLLLSWPLPFRFRQRCAWQCRASYNKVWALTERNVDSCQISPQMHQARAAMGNKWLDQLVELDDIWDASPKTHPCHCCEVTVG